MSTPGQAWYLRRSVLPGKRYEVSCFENDAHVDGFTVEASGADGQVIGEPDGADMLWSAGLDDQNRSRVVVMPGAAPDAPDAWYVAIRSTQDDRPRMTLVAFCTDHLPDATVVPDASFFTMPVTSDQQSAAIRWWADTAVVDEIFVQAEHRRSHLGTKLIYAASGFHQHHGWPGRLHSDGRRTDLGQQFVVGLRHPERIAEWSDKAHPMDPETN